MCARARVRARVRACVCVCVCVQASNFERFIVIIPYDAQQKRNGQCNYTQALQYNHKAYAYLYSVYTFHIGNLLICAYSISIVYTRCFLMALVADVLRCLDY